MNKSVQNGLLKRRIKRGVDLLGGTAGLCAAVPLAVAAATALMLENGTDIIFKQQRLGRDGKPFTLYKFRTMKKDTETVTPVGKFLRKHSLDELPQLVNVVKGDMSLIGPRPLSKKALDISEDVIRQNEWLADLVHMRHSVKPGLASFYAVRRQADSVNWKSLLLSDAYYVRNHNLQMDFYLMKEAVLVSLRGRSGTNNSLKTEARLSHFVATIDPQEKQLFDAPDQSVPAGFAYK